MRHVNQTRIALILGGARSGKSSFAEACARHFESVTYFATAQVVEGDEEMESRIAIHRQRRPDHWTTVEPPERLDSLLRKQRERPSGCVVIDCATLWLGWELTANYKKYSKDQLVAHMENEINHFVETVCQLPSSVIVVSNETGCGVVPEHASGRMFRDLQGILNTRIAEKSEAVCLLVAGQSLLIKGGGEAAGTEGYSPVARVDARWLARALG